MLLHSTAAHPCQATAHPYIGSMGMHHVLQLPQERPNLP